MWTAQRIVGLKTPGTTPNGDQPSEEQGVVRDQLLVMD